MRAHVPWLDRLPVAWRPLRARDRAGDESTGDETDRDL